MADPSGPVSLRVGVDGDTDPLALCLDSYDVMVPAVVVEELETVASDEDDHAVSAGAALDRTGGLDVRSVELDSDFPLDDVENAPVTLANDLDAGLGLSDEFNNLGVMHGSLAIIRPVTTPTLLTALVRRDALDADAALTVLDEIRGVRSWDGNSYVHRARSLLDRLVAPLLRGRVGARLGRAVARRRRVTFQPPFGFLAVLGIPHVDAPAVHPGGVDGAAGLDQQVDGTNTLVPGAAPGSVSLYRSSTVGLEWTARRRVSNL